MTRGAWRGWRSLHPLSWGESVSGATERRLSLGALVLGVLGFLFGLPLAADVHPNTEGGIAVDQAFQVGDLDNVNLFNGSLTLASNLAWTLPTYDYQWDAENGANAYMTLSCSAKRLLPDKIRTLR